jgi:regulatory protein
MQIEWMKKTTARNTWEIYVDGKNWREVHTTLFRKPQPFDIHVKTRAELDIAFLEMEYTHAFRYALQCLNRKTYPTFELERCLKSKGVSSTTHSRVIQECTRLGFLDDKEWIRQFIMSHAAKRLGPAAIIQKLRAKGVSETSARTWVQQCVGEDKEGQKKQILHHLQTRYRRHNLNDPLIMRKAISFLIRKGFSHSLIREALQENAR